MVILFVLWGYQPSRGIFFFSRELGKAIILRTAGELLLIADEICVHSQICQFKVCRSFYFSSPARTPGRCAREPRLITPVPLRMTTAVRYHVFACRGVPRWEGCYLVHGGCAMLDASAMRTEQVSCSEDCAGALGLTAAQEVCASTTGRFGTHTLPSPTIRGGPS